MLLHVDLLQKEIIEKINFSIDVESNTKMSDILYCLITIPPEIGEIALGNIGAKIFKFISKADISHPEIISVVNNIFDNDKDFIGQIIELLSLTENNIKLKIVKNFCNIISRKKFSRYFTKNTNYAIRVLNNKDYRDIIRRQKKMQVVCLKDFSSWENEPEDFQIFNRYNDPYSEVVKVAERKANKYYELGCKLLGDKVLNLLKKNKNNISDCHYGFNRISITNAAIILAKLNKFRLRTSWDTHDNKTVKIVTTFDFGVSNNTYEARVYPIHDLIHIAPPNIINIINHLDNFPEACGKAIFDNYLVLMPSVKSVDKATDELLMKECVCPILLGERDNKSHFICYWR